MWLWFVQSIILELTSCFERGRIETYPRSVLWCTLFLGQTDTPLCPLLNILPRHDFAVHRWLDPFRHPLVVAHMRIAVLAFGGLASFLFPNGV